MSTTTALETAHTAGCAQKGSVGHLVVRSSAHHNGEKNCGICELDSWRPLCWQQQRVQATHPRKQQQRPKRPQPLRPQRQPCTTTAAHRRLQQRQRQRHRQQRPQPAYHHSARIRSILVNRRRIRSYPAPVWRSSICCTCRRATRRVVPRR